MATKKYYTYKTTDGYTVTDNENPELGTLVCTGTHAECTLATGCTAEPAESSEATPDTVEPAE